MLEQIYQFIKAIFDPSGRALIGNHLSQSSSFSSDIDSLIGLVTIIVGFWFFVAEFALFYLVWKYRKRDGHRSEYVTGEEKRHMRWIKIPHDIIIVCDVVIVFMAITVWYKIKQDMPPPEQEIRVIAQQWSWTFVDAGNDKILDTPDDIRTVNELHVEVNKVYHFRLEALDVLHDFSVPVFRLKQDAIPGRVIRGWFKPTKVGIHDVQCAEMCGLGHGVMVARILIETPAEHAAWLSNNSPAQRVALNP